MLDSVTLWQSQLSGWVVESTDRGLYLRHVGSRSCPGITFAEVPPRARLGTFAVSLGHVLSALSHHRCPSQPPTTPRVVDGPASPRSGT